MQLQCKCTVYCTCTCTVYCIHTVYMHSVCVLVIEVRALLNITSSVNKSQAMSSSWTEILFQIFEEVSARHPHTFVSISNCSYRCSQFGFTNDCTFALPSLSVDVSHLSPGDAVGRWSPTLAGSNGVGARSMCIHSSSLLLTKKWEELLLGTQKTLQQF